MCLRSPHSRLFCGTPKTSLIQDSASLNSSVCRNDLGCLLKIQILRPLPGDSNLEETDGAQERVFLRAPQVILTLGKFIKTLD